MRRLTVAIVAALLMCAAPAYAQMGGGDWAAEAGRMGKGLPDDKKDTRSPEQKKKDESAFKDAVGRIPDQKYDPWGKVR